MSFIYTGINKNTGETVSFSRKWGQKEFTEEECEKLANGETISFPYTSPSGRIFSRLSGKLTELERNGKTFLSFTPAWHYECPPGFGGVLFTEEEKKILESGGYVTRHDFTSHKSGKIYSARVHLDDGKIVPEFTDENGKPLSTNRIKLGAKPMENNKSNPFVDELFKASHDGLGFDEVENNRVPAIPATPSLTSGRVNVDNVTLKSVVEDQSEDNVQLIYSNGVIVYVSKQDYAEGKDYIKLCSIDEVIREYAIDVDASSLIGNTNKKDRFDF